MTNPGDTLVNRLYRPSHEHFDTAAARLAAVAAESCDSADDDPLKTAFQQTVHAFSRIELLRVGPILENNRLNRLFYWPDRRRAGERQLRALLSDQSTELTAASMPARSVAVQGLPAMERLLYGSAAELPDKLRCTAIVAIAGNIAAIAKGLRQRWDDDQGIARELRSPQKNDALFRSREEVVRSVLTQLDGGLGVIIEKKISPVLSREKPRRSGTPFATSGLSYLNLAANIDSLRALAIDSKLADAAGLEAELGFEFRVARQHVESLSSMMPPAPWPTLADEREIGLLRALVSTLSSIRNTLNERLSPSLGIRTGFNAEDGD